MKSFKRGGIRAQRSTRVPEQHRAKSCKVHKYFSESKVRGFKCLILELERRISIAWVLQEGADRSVREQKK